MIKYILMILMILLLAPPVVAQQKLLMPEYSLKRDLPPAPTQDILDSPKDAAESKMIKDITPNIIEPTIMPKIEAEEIIDKAEQKKVIEILPSKQFIEQENTDQATENISLGSTDIIRGLFFGLSKQIVKDYEDILPVAEEENGIVYVDEMWGFVSSIGYDFMNDNLWRIQVINEKKYYDPVDRIPDIGIIQLELEKKFGKPTSENFIWSKDLEKDFPQFWGWALHRKELIINVIWEFKDVQIKLIAEAEIMARPEIRVEFISKKYRPIKKDLNFLIF